MMQFNEYNRPIEQPLTKWDDLGSNFQFKSCSTRLVRDTVQNMNHFSDSCFQDPVSDGTRMYKCYWCGKTYDKWFGDSRCSLRKEFEKIVTLMDWWNELPRKKEPSIPSFSFDESTVRAAERLSVRDCRLCTKQYPNCEHRRDALDLRNDFRKLENLMKRFNVLSRMDMYKTLKELKQASSLAWVNVVTTKVFDFLLGFEQFGWHLEDLADAAVHQMRAYDVLSIHPVRGALARLETLGSDTWKRHARTMIKSFLRTARHPPELLLEALHMISKYEQWERWSLITLAVWKGQCQGDPHDPLLEQQPKMDDARATQDKEMTMDGGMKAHKEMYSESNAMTIVVSAVKPFLDDPFQYQICRSSAGQFEVGPIGWRIFCKVRRLE